MGQRGAARLNVGSKGCQVGRHRCADVLTEHQGYAQIDGEHPRGTEQDGDGHHGCRRLHHTRDGGANGEESQDCPVAARVEGGEEVHDAFVVSQVHLLAGGAEHHEREKHERDAEEEVANVAVLLLIDEHDAQEKSGEYEVRQVDVVAERHDPCRQRRTDVGTHDDGDGLSEGQQSGVDKRNGHHRRG